MIGFSHEPLGHRARLENRVRLANGFDQRLAAIDPGAERAKAALNARGKVWAAATTNNAGCGV
jgi:hypothetical protein